MATARAILRAAKAAQGQQFRPGAAAVTPPPQGEWMGAYSPTAINSTPGMFGYDPGYGPFMPRPPEQFTQGAFSPFSPILPVPVDQPEPGERLPYPRRESYQVGWNLPQSPPGSEGLKLASFATLQTLADLYSVARACIQVRKAEIRGLDWDIVLTKDAEKAYKNDRAAMRDFGERRDEARKFFSRPDPDYWNFESWLDDLLEQVFVFDALTLFLQPVRGRGMKKGLLGSDLDCLQLIDGQTIRPLYDVRGGAPRPPAPSLQQFLWGVPRSDFTAVLTGDDLREAGLSEAEWRGFTRDQMLYLPMTRRRWTPYGFPPVERALIPIMAGLQKQGYQLDFYREGTVPAVFIAPGDASMTPNQIRELQDALNAVAGDPAWHHKVIVLPPGSKTMPQKDAQLADDFDSIVMTQVCMAFDVKPMELGILPQVSTVASPFAAREAAQASRTMHQRVSTKPLMKFLTGIFNGILQDVCGQRDMRFLFSGQEEVQDQAAMTDLLVKQVQSGLRSIDEARDELGLTPWGYDETSEPDVFTPAGPIPLAEATHLALAQAQNAAAGPDGTVPAKKPPRKPSSGAHAAAQGGMNRAGRPGSVTERQRSRGGRLAPTHAQGTGAPGRATGRPAPKAAMAELEALGRHLRKGRAISTWEPVHIDARTLAIISEDIAKGLTPEQAVTVAAQIYKATGGGQQQNPAPGQQPQPGQPQTPQQIIATYGPQIAAAFAAAITAAAALIAKWTAGTLAVTAAVLAAMILDELRRHLGAVLHDLWRQAWDAAAAHAQEASGPVPDRHAIGAALDAFLATTGETWLATISGTRERKLIQAIKDALAAGDPQAVTEKLEELLGASFRPEMIAVTEVMRAWNAALTAAMKAAGTAYRTWNTARDGKVCPVCLANQAQGPVPLSVPFQSGAMTSPQHPNCRCYLLPWVPKATKALTRHVADNGQVYWSGDGDYAAGGGAMPPSAHDEDGTQVTYPALWPFPNRAAPPGPVPGGTAGATAGGEPPRWDATAPFPYDRSLPAGDDAAWGQAAGIGSRPGEMWPSNYMDGYWPEGGHGDQQPPASTIPGGPGRGRAPNAVGKAADAAAKFLHGAPEAKASTVLRLMGKNFPPEALEWARKVRWVGPVEVPAALWDYSSEKEWAAHHQAGRVDEFARKLKAGKKVDPVIGTVKPGHNHIRCVDGHHRLLAAKRIGWPVRAYIAFLPEAGNSPADRTYLLQEHSGTDPQNKSFTAGALGIGPASGLVPLATQPPMPNAPDALRKLSKKAVNYRPAIFPQRRCATCVMWRAGRCTLVKGDIEPDAVCDRWYPRDASKSAKEPHVAGLMVRAADTGRVLMLQRAITEDDPAAGMWENPGGHAEPGETLTQAACREWSEETGMQCPRGTLTGSWTSSDGIYRGFVLEIPSEADLPIFGDRDDVWNPDDPHGDKTEAIAWWDPVQFRGNPAVRPEMQRDLAVVLEALGLPEAIKSAETPMLEATPHLLGTHGLWHTPDRHVGERQKLPNYIEHIAAALMRDQGMDESRAIATAINAVKRWARGDLHWGRGKVTPEVMAASQRALAEWEKLRASHRD